MPHGFATMQILETHTFFWKLEVMIYRYYNQFHFLQKIDSKSYLNAICSLIEDKILLDRIHIVYVPTISYYDEIHLKFNLILFVPEKRTKNNSTSQLKFFLIDFQE